MTTGIDSEIMTKNTTAVLLLVSVVLISSAVAAVIVFGNYSGADPEPGGSNLDGLIDDLGAFGYPLSGDLFEIKLQNTAGRFVRLDDYRGRIVFLNFWTTWCPTCRTEMPSMERLHRKLLDKDFAMVTVNIKESAAQVKTFFDKYKLSFTALLDPTGEVSTAFGVRAIPTTFILDKGGTIIGSITGPREWDSRKFVDLFAHLADG